MKAKIISCEIFRGEIEHLLGKHGLDIETEYLEIALHNETDNLRSQIRERIDAAPDDVTHILLFYGLCGNGTAGISSPNHTIVIPRAHDCCTILLGSRDRFQSNFGHRLSAEWTSNIYYEKKGWGSRSDNRDLEQLGLNMSREEYIKYYGEENGAYLWETLQPKGSSEIIFIRVPETEDPETEERVKLKAEENEKTFLVLEGSLSLLEKLILAQWDGDFLIVPPQQEIQPSFDDEVIKA